MKQRQRKGTSPGTRSPAIKASLSSRGGGVNNVMISGLYLKMTAFLMFCAFY